MSGKNTISRTWDEWCLIKLKEIGKSTQQEWAEAMGYKNSFNMNKVVENNTNKLIITKIPLSRLKFYEVKEDVIFKKIY